MMSPYVITALLGSLAFWANALVIASIKGAVVFGAAFAVSRALRNRPASARHLLWGVALCGVLVMPVLSPFLFVWRVPLLPRAVFVEESLDVVASQESAASMRGASDAGSAARPALSVNEAGLGATLARGEEATAGASVWPKWFAALWALGVLAVLGRLLLGVVCTRRIRRSAVRLTGERWEGLLADVSRQVGLARPVKLFRSDRALMPMAWGVISPHVLLPSCVDEWSEERVRLVLSHELSHVKRGDMLTQMLAQFVCALYWFNPLVWLAARQFRKEQEWACDERVLHLGVKAPTYAEHLLEISRSMGQNSWAAATTMAHRSNLESRLRAILSPAPRRRAGTRLIFSTVVAAMLVVVLSLGAIEPALRANELSPRPVDSMAGETESAAVAPDAERRQGASAEPQAQTEPPKFDAEPKARTAPSPQEVAQPVAADAQRNDEQEDSARGADDTFDGLTDEEQNRLRSMGLTSAYVKELAAAGYTGLTAEQLISMFTNDVRGGFIRGLKAAGYDGLAPKDLVALRTNGITPEVINSFRAVNYAEFKARNYIAFRSNGVTPAYLASLRAEGYSNLTPKQIVDLHVGGVTPEFIRRMRARGHERVAPELLIELRQQEQE